MYNERCGQKTAWCPRYTCATSSTIIRHVDTYIWPRHHCSCIWATVYDFCPWSLTLTTSVGWTRLIGPQHVMTCLLLTDLVPVAQRSQLKAVHSKCKGLHLTLCLHTYSFRRQYSMSLHIHFPLSCMHKNVASSWPHSWAVAPPTTILTSCVKSCGDTGTALHKSACSVQDALTGMWDGCVRAFR